MLGFKRTILGISDLKKIFQSVKSRRSIDFLGYALSSLKRRVEDFIFTYHVLSVDELILKLESDDNFFQLFLKAILVDTTEMFRDPEFWDDFKNLVLKKYRYAGEIRIWIPDCNSGEELYTIQIILQQLKLNEKSIVVVSTMSELNIDRIKKATLDQKKMEINIANYERYEEGGKLEDFFTMKLNAAILKEEFFENVTIIKHDLFAEDPPGMFDLILFRNKMLYYNPQLKIEALNKITATLKPGGYIAIGIKELLDYPMWEQDYTIISETEKIYKKLLS